MTDSGENISVALSKPRIGAGLSVEQALAQLLWAAQGITGHFDQRTAPSAGALLSCLRAVDDSE